MTDSPYRNQPGYRAGAPETSKEAAVSVSDTANSRRALAARFVTERKFSGATADEVAAAFGWDKYSSRPRLAELHGSGVIADSGARRLAASGRRQAVWVAREFAEAAE